MTRRTVSGGRASRPRAPTRGSARRAPATRAGRPGRRARPTGRRANSGLVEQLERELDRRLERVERLHVDVQVGAALARAREQRPQPRRPRRRRRARGACGRSIGGQRRDLDREVGARQRPERVALEQRPRRPRAASSASSSSVAAQRAAYASASSELTVASPSRSTDAAMPSRQRSAELAGRRGGRLAGDEAVRRVAHAGRDGAAERPRVRPSRRRAAARPQAAARALELAGEAREMAAEVLGRAARGCDVDQAEQRVRSSSSRDASAIARRSTARAGWRPRRPLRRGDLAADAVDLGLERPVILDGGRRHVAPQRTPRPDGLELVALVSRSVGPAGSAVPARRIVVGEAPQVPETPTAAKPAANAEKRDEAVGAVGLPDPDRLA